MSTAMKTDYRSLYDKDYIGAWDLVEGDKVITITKVIAGQLTGQGGRKSKKPVIYFRGSEKGFALNATNGKTIAALYGNYTEGWVGKKIALYKSTTRNPSGDGDVDCIRVRPQAPKGADSSFAAGDDDQQFVTAEQAKELEELCAARGITDKFLTQAKVEQFAHVLAVDYAGGKRWIEKQPVQQPAEQV